MGDCEASTGLDLEVFPRRSAVESLGGHVYQIAVSALAWVDLSDTEDLYLGSISAST